MALPVLVLLWGACGYTLVGLLAHGTGPGDGTPVLAALVGYPVLVLLVVVLPPAAWAIGRHRVVLDVANRRVERRPGRVSVPVSELRAVRAVPPARVDRANRGLRVRVVDAAGGVAAQLDESTREWGPALRVLREWAREEPRLVDDEYTRALLLGADAPR